MGRAILKSLKESTLLTFFEICKQWNIKKDVHFTFNSIEGVIKFYNGSEVHLKDLFAYPSDPEFDCLGSTEYTGALIDECSQVSEKAKNILMSRLRYKLIEFDIIPKLLMCSNPSKNFLYSDFYKASKDGSIKDFRKFVPSLVTENPYISPFYVENLKKLDRMSMERLLHGSWEYDDDPAKLFEYDKITDLFSNEYVENKEDQMFLTVDVARFGSDQTVMFVWKGLHVLRVLTYKHQGTDITSELIEKIAKEYHIPRSNIIADEDGLGAGVVDHVKGIKGFINNSACIQKNDKKPVNFANLKSQCYFLLSDYVRDGRISIYKDIPINYKNALIEELEVIKKKDPDKDQKISITPKDKIKELIGRSNDHSDAFMMRMYFELNKKNVSFFFA